MQVRKSGKFWYCFTFTPEEIYFLNYMVKNGPDFFHSNLESALDEIMRTEIDALKERYKS